MPPAVSWRARLSSWKVAAFLFGAAMSLLPIGADAAAGRPAGPVRLEFEGASGCDDASEFWARLESRLGPVPRGPGNEVAVRLHVRIVRQVAAFAGELRVSERGTVSDKRRVSAKTCADLLNALSLTAALALDHGRAQSGASDSAEAADRQAEPAAAASGTSAGAAPTSGTSASSGGPPPVATADLVTDGEARQTAGAAARAEPPVTAPPPPSSAQTPAPGENRGRPRGAADVAVGAEETIQAQTSSADSVASAPAATGAAGPLRFGFGARAHAARLVSPFVGLGGGVFGRLAAAAQPDQVRPSLALALLYVPNDLLRSPDVAVTWTALALTACPGLGAAWSVVVIELCAHAAAGWVSAEHRAISNPTNSRRGFATAGGVGRLSVPIAGRLTVDIEAGVAAPLVRRRFVTTSPETVVGDSGWLLWMASVGLGWST